MENVEAWGLDRLQGVGIFVGRPLAFSAPRNRTGSCIEIGSLGKRKQVALVL